MINADKFYASARAVINTELEAINSLLSRIDENFATACQYFMDCQGRVVVFGMGKSGHIGNKIAATLASTGTPAFFIHPAEANHGDMGMVTPKDVILAISNSGETNELINLLPIIQHLKTPLITMTGNPQSTLARHATVNVDISVPKEACPLGLAPTSSTTAALVIGDAIAIALLEVRGFTAENFAFFHPGGSLGRRLLLKIQLPRPLPTPILAYAVRALGAVAGVMVTASHNPPEDNGYKVYLGESLGGALGAGAQIVPPVDAEIEAAIRAVGPLSAVPLGDPGVVLDDGIVRSYVERAAAVADPDVPRDLAIAYTPLHGVGGAIMADVLTRAGFVIPAVVPSQSAPDPDFPTVSFPNPEEPGAMDALLAVASASHADIAIASDPDADRCAVAIPLPGGGWRALRGDEVGILLADHLMRRGYRGRYATTIVSSSLLRLRAFKC